jgi:hypothetical protein
MYGIRKKNLIPCSESIQPYQQLIVRGREDKERITGGERKQCKSSHCDVVEIRQSENKTYAFLPNCVSHSIPVRVKKKQSECFNDRHLFPLKFAKRIGMPQTQKQNNRITSQ